MQAFQQELGKKSNIQNEELIKWKATSNTY